MSLFSGMKLKVASSSASATASHLSTDSISKSGATSKTGEQRAQQSSLTLLDAGLNTDIVKSDTVLSGSINSENTASQETVDSTLHDECHNEDELNKLGHNSAENITYFTGHIEPLQSKFSSDLEGLELNFQIEQTDDVDNNEKDECEVRKCVDEEQDDEVADNDVKTEAVESIDGCKSGFSFIGDESYDPKDDVVDSEPHNGDKPIDSSSQLPRYEIHLTKNEEFELFLQTSEANINSIREDILEVEKKQQYLLDSYINVNAQKLGKIMEVKKLQDEQAQSLQNEDFEKAVEIDNKIQALHDQIESMSQTTLPSLEEITSFTNTISSLYSQEIQLKRENLNKMNIYKTKEENELEEKRRKFAEGLSKEEEVIELKRVQLLKATSHLSIDKEHLEKCEKQLECKIAERCSSYIEKKCELQEQLSHVQNEILEVEQKLSALRKKENEITNGISEEDANISIVTADFAEETIKLKEERNNIESKEKNLNDEMTQFKKMEETTESLKIQFEKEDFKFSSIIDVIDGKVTQEEKCIDQLMAVQSKITQLYQEDLDWPSLQRKNNEVFLDMKKKVTTMETDVKEKTTHVLKLQTLVTSLRKKVNDIEEQINSLNEAKKLAVTGRNFVEAKRLANEVKELIGNGEETQKQLESTVKDITNDSKLVDKLQEKYNALKEVLQKQDFEIDMELKDYATETIHKLEAQLDVDEIPTFHRHLLEAKLLSCYFTIKEICIRHDVDEPTNLKNYCLTLRKEEGTVYTDAAADAVSMMTEVGKEADDNIKQLEEELQKAVDDEDYGKADILMIYYVECRTTC
uniref:Uncharacterized protein PFB0145c-like n=1 Tax=Saccoglossus kowalevskii TaxID=10224 RepID=A0ABM0GNN8_SACKO|nr:PREDICTED: uncharacterized protein PFB0145c-like [Saccoglossus kowalevskii]